METQLRHELAILLNDGAAHSGPEAILAEYPMSEINSLPPNVTYTPWQLLEHIRFCQQEILEQIEAEVMPTYQFPDDFWPGMGIDATSDMWQESVDAFFRDLTRLQDLAAVGDLAAPCRNNADASLLHALLNIAAHNHYHLGEFAILREVMSTWPAK